MRATKAIIHLDNLQHNILEIKRLVGSRKICLPVKADAYGHGAMRVAIAAIRAGVSALAVASVQEGVELRNAGIVAPIISMSHPILEEVEDIVRYDLHPLVIDESFIDDLNAEACRQKKCAGVHLKIDTGMGRIGCDPAEAVKLAMQISRNKNLELKGVATHFSVSDSKAEEDVAYTKKQIETFSTAIESIRNAGLNPGVVHAANSGAVLQYPESYFDMVRPGVLAYGYSPDSELDGILDVRPVMSLVTKVVTIKKVLAGTAVSYGRKWIAEHDTYIGTLPIGYADGLNRRLSPGLKVRIGDEFFPVVGRICMDQCMIDLGPTPWVQRWDEVIIFGDSSGNIKNNTATDLAEIAGTIHYELTCNINKRVPRLFIDEQIK